MTPRKLAAARRAVQKEKDRCPLFPELLKHKSAEERLKAVASDREQWWQRMRDHRAKQWRRARKALRALPPGPRAAIKRYWQTSGFPGIPRDFRQGRSDFFIDVRSHLAQHGRVPALAVRHQYERSSVLNLLRVLTNPWDMPNAQDFTSTLSSAEANRRL